jgi:hypothetical protein
VFEASYLRGEREGGGEGGGRAGGGGWKRLVGVYITFIERERRMEIKRTCRVRFKKYKYE